MTARSLIAASDMTDLSQFDNSWYSPGRNRFVQILWFCLGAPVLRCSLLPSSAIRRALLRLFGARVGVGVVIKPGVRIKYPWRFSIEKNSWLGEDCWIDNLAHVSIGANVCISQGAYFCTGNHDWSDHAFGLVVKPISIGDGAWIGAKTLIAPGVSVNEEAVATAGSVVTHNIHAREVHAGNPARFVRTRVLRTASVGLEKGRSRE